MRFVGQVAPGKREKAAIAVLMGLFFSFLYVDTRRLNYVERLLEQSVAQLPSRHPASSALSATSAGDVNLVGHTLDRAASGVASATPTTNLRRAVSYPRPPDPVVVTTEDRDTGALQEGTYVVKPDDPPLYQIYLRDHYLDSRLLKAG